MLNDYKKLVYEQYTLSKDEVGHEIVTYGEPSQIIGSITPITKDLEGLLASNYIREKEYFLIKTREQININDRIDGKMILKKVRGDYYVATN